MNFTLLADEDGSVAKKFGVALKPGGVVKTKDAAGNSVELKRGVTAARTTFVIGKDGKIVHVDPNANAVEDAKKVVEMVKKLKK